MYDSIHTNHTNDAVPVLVAGEQLILILRKNVFLIIIIRNLLELLKSLILTLVTGLL